MTGWEPAEVTSFEYDADGRVVRAVTVRESEFSLGDVAALVASRRAESVRRSPTGYTLAEAKDPANQFAFEVKNPKRDWAVAALNSAQERFYTQYPKAKGDPSLIWDVRRRD